ncbi:MAG: alpha-galactosidase [Clostridia bacterium]|nr:alpha-galactosidase [Clostridia bacterium]
MIQFDETNQTFHLRNAFVSLVLRVQPDGDGEKELLMPYLGAALDDPASCLYLCQPRDGASFDSPRQTLPYACPTEGRGDYRPALVCAVDGEGQRCTELFYTGYRVEKGKPALTGLPAAYVEDEAEAETLFITLRDALTGLEAELCYTLYADRPVITESIRYQNTDSEPLTLRNAGSACVTLPGRYDFIHLHGAWAKERAIERVSPARMIREISSCRGASGHEHNPFVALAAQDTTEFSGECLGAALVYSGDFAITADENAYGSTRLTLGLNPRSFSWRLHPGETFQAPEVIFAFSDKGLNGMSQTLHSLIRQRICRGAWRDRERPILINNWEATYFNFDHDKIIKIAKAAADVGTELFVLDDGWFGKRNLDNCSLGDWVVNKEKLPRGLDGLGKDINALGLKFGLWFEPEMVSPDSDLYRAHPDWCLHADKRRRTTARQQLILDMGRKEVQDYVIEAVSKVLREAPIGYVKWDMNRNFKEAGSEELTDGRQGETAHRYMLGLYRVLETVTQSFPDVLFESCSGGGGRFDAGMLHYMPQTWTSDDTDAVARLSIQYGTSLCYPTSAMGAHVSAVPNHQIGRVTDMRMRGDVALGGNFGYELDLSAQTPEDMEEIRRQVAQVKALRKTTQQGVFTRLLSPFEGNETAWQFADEQRVILCAYRVLNMPNGEPLRVRLHGVPTGIYKTPDGSAVSSSDLERAGVPLPFASHDFASLVLVFERISPA